MAKTAEKKTLSVKQRILNIYIGWDSREPIAADVCKFSILKHATIPVNIQYLKQDDLRSNGIYTRDVDILASTEFTFTRFLVPYLNNYDEWAIFVDCDFVFTADVAELLELADSDSAVHVVQHDYTPPEGVKMDGKQQSVYPRKNWSSMILWNCAHPANQRVDLDFVNSASGQQLHRFTWLKKHQIGNLLPEWNWLVGWYREGRDGSPKALHYTQGGPWFDNYRNCEYADVWNSYRTMYESAKPYRNAEVDDLGLSPLLSAMIKNLLQNRVDPHNVWYNTDANKITQWVEQRSPASCYGVVDGDIDGEQQEGRTKVDHFIESFVQGADGVIGFAKNTPQLPLSVPAVIRGIAKRKVIKRCLEEGRDFYYIDTGYFGNGKHKNYHRISKNSLQYVAPLKENCSDDRFRLTGVGLHKYRPGKNILICPPSQKAMNYWDLDLDQWLEDTMTTIKNNTDRPIMIRKKAGRDVRVNTDTIEMALNQDVHCMVTFNSIAAVESLIYGKPVFTMGPNAAAPLANTDLTQIDSPFMPELDQVRNLCCNLAYAQFTTAEMKNGTAWRILNEF